MEVQRRQGLEIADVPSSACLRAPSLPQKKTFDGKGERVCRIDLLEVDLCFLIDALFLVA